MMTRSHVVGLLMTVAIINGFCENFIVSAMLGIVALIVLMEDDEEYPV